MRKKLRREKDEPNVTKSRTEKVLPSLAMPSSDIVLPSRAQLRSVAPGHPWIVKYGDMDASFDRCAAQMAS